jgi:hypothetical protein
MAGEACSTVGRGHFAQQRRRAELGRIPRQSIDSYQESDRVKFRGSDIVRSSSVLMKRLRNKEGCGFDATLFQNETAPLPI